MARDKKTWHPKFIEYMNMIVNHPNYKGLPITRNKDGSLNWIATAKSKIGQQRKEWAENKARELNIPIRPGVYRDVMLQIHPTKWKPCQICGKSMSLYYHYPNANFLKALNKKFNTSFTDCDHISDIWDKLVAQQTPEESIKRFFITKGSLNLPITATKDEIINALEYTCRTEDKKCLGPGAMSNFPDRFDGYHTYNRCCRASQDKGRSKENLKTYTKDRRAYEYWSDGNIHAADEFMGSSFFEGISADHIGPISLGFVHDPRYLQPMSNSDNSSKRDRLQLVDIEKIIATEERTIVYPMSWQSRLIWEFIRKNYRNNENKIPTIYRDALKQNMVNFMFILKTILDNCPTNGKTFLTQAFLAPHYQSFDYTYKFNKNGDIISKEPRHNTDRNKYEIERYNRVAMESVVEYNAKNNRKINNDLTSNEKHILSIICENIENHCDFVTIRENVIRLMEQIESRIIQTL